MAEEIAVEVRGLTKSYPGVVALNHVSLSVRAGDCHALMGENGAGKSTLGKTLAGLIQPDSGEILLFGKHVKFGSPLAAAKAGISIVHQELLFCENMTVEENLCLEDLPSLGPFLDRKTMRRRASEWLARIGADIDPGSTVSALPPGLQQLVQIAGALGLGAKVVIFDEPTSSLSMRETEILFEQIEKLKAEGVTCIYVSHRMDEIFQLCDAVSVLRDGQHVQTLPIGDVDHNALVRLMVGRNIEEKTRGDINPGEPLLRVQDLSRPGKFANVSFEVRAGEIVGLAGLVGSGRTEIAEALFGIDTHATGSIELMGKPVRPDSPAGMMSRGLGLVPEDRKRLGLVLSMNARENISLPTLPEEAILGFVNKRKERALAQSYFDLLRVRAPSTEFPALGLSGGNQQKLVLAKWLAAHCDVLILDEPTRGVDVGAKAEIHDLVRELARQGKAILVISSELPEVIALSTRILAINSGHVAGEISAQEATEESLLRLMTGVGAA